MGCGARCKEIFVRSWGWTRLLIAVGLLLFLLMQLWSEPSMRTQRYAKSFTSQVDLKDSLFGAAEMDTKESRKDVKALWGWDPKCLPSVQLKWHGGTTPNPADKNGTQLPIPFWSAIPYIKNSETRILIVGPLYSTETLQKFNWHSPEPNMAGFKFSCYFPAIDVNVPGVAEEDPHRNIAMFSCALPAEDALAQGKSYMTEIHVHDWSHHGIMKVYACMKPISKREIDVAAVATTRNVGCHLEEWLESLFLLGFDHVFLYDHFNEDNATFSVLPKYIDQGLVTVFPWRQSRDVLWGGKYSKAQIMVYVDALYRFQAKWMFIGDVDEFPWLPSVMQPPGMPDPIPVPHWNSSDISTLKLPPVPAVPTFSTPPTRSSNKKALMELFSKYDNDTVGALEMRQLLFGTGPGVPQQPLCPPDDQIKLISQIYRHVDTADRPNQSKKYFARRSTVQIPSIHEIAKGQNIIPMPLNELRMHHYWREKRAADPRTNDVLDVSSIPWGLLVRERVKMRRSGKLVGLD